MRNVVEISLSLQLVLLKHFAEHLQADFFPLILTSTLGNKQNHCPGEEIGSEELSNLPEVIQLG